MIIFMIIPPPSTFPMPVGDLEPPSSEFNTANCSNISRVAHNTVYVGSKDVVLTPENDSIVASHRIYVLSDVS